MPTPSPAGMAELDMRSDPVDRAGGGERPIIFSAPMVRALLEGRKTQTRRVLKPQPDPLAPVGFIQRFESSSTFDLHTRPRFAHGQFVGSDRMQIVETHYAPGARLWVREAFARFGDNSDDVHACPDMRVPAYYRADAVSPEQSRWRSPIHMPRALSRLTLIVESVRVERLQDISRSDAIAEGIAPLGFQAGFEMPGEEGGTRYDTARDAYAALWRSIHGSDTWNANPWVAAIGFRVVRANIDTLAPDTPADVGGRA